MSMAEYAKRRSQVAISNEVRAYEARTLRMSPYRTPLAPYDYASFSNKTVTPPDPFSQWKFEREAYIDGDDSAMERMLALVNLQDWDRYDEVAEDDIAADRAANPVPVAPPPAVAWWKGIILILLFWRRRA